MTHINSSYSRETRDAIVKFTRKGGPFRQILTNAGEHPDTEAWRGTTGLNVAREIYESITRVATEGAYPISDEIVASAHHIAKSAGFVAIGEAMS